MRHRKMKAAAIPAALAALGTGAWFWFWLRRVLLFWGADRAWAIGLSCIAAVIAPALVFFRPIPIRVRSVCVAYLLLFGLLAEGVLRLTGPVRLLESGAVPVLLTAAALAYAAWHGKKTVLTRYTLHTGKALPGGTLRVGLVSDVHMGLSVDAERLQEAARLLSRERLDLMVIAGDLADDQTTKEEMQAACEILGGIETRLGTFFAYGNHDSASHGPPLAFSHEELATALARNGVTVLEDRCATLPGPLVIAGRRDGGILGTERRRGLGALLEGTDAPTIVCDHQPWSAAESADAGAMLQLSGHTHAGQLWPANWLMRLGSGAPQYGCRLIKDTWVIVSCGLGTRGCRLRSGSTAEVVLIEMQNADCRPAGRRKHAAPRR